MKGSHRHENCGTIQHVPAVFSILEVLIHWEMASNYFSAFLLMFLEQDANA